MFVTYNSQYDDCKGTVQQSTFLAQENLENVLPNCDLFLVIPWTITKKSEIRIVVVNKVLLEF